MEKTSGHTGHDNFEKYEEAFEIEFTFQPPNSPDLNINDLTFFNSLDSMVCHMKDSAHDMLGLIDCVTEAFDAYDSAKIESGFGHFLRCSVRFWNTEAETNHDDHMTMYVKILLQAARLIL